MSGSEDGSKEVTGSEGVGAPGSGRGDADEPAIVLEGESCAKCGATIAQAGAVCERCGSAAEVGSEPGVRDRTGPSDAERTREPGLSGGELAAGVFVTPGRGGAKTLLIAGGVLTAAAMVAVGVAVPAKATWVVVLGAVVLVLYNVAVHVGTGLVAVWTASKITEERFGGTEAVELAAARIFAAYALFEFVRYLKLPLGPVGPIAAWALAAGLYWLAVWVLFCKPKTVASLIVLSHAVLWMTVQLGMSLGGWVRSRLIEAGT